MLVKSMFKEIDPAAMPSKNLQHARTYYVILLTRRNWRVAQGFWCCGHPCKKRKYGARSLGIVHAKIVKGGLSAHQEGPDHARHSAASYQQATAG